MNQQRIRSIVKLFGQARYRHDVYTVFSDWCEMAAISISNAVDLRRREVRESRNMEIVGRYDRAAVETFPTILGEVTLALEEGMNDVLGATFHALELHNKARGQFFTPMEICRMMARMLLEDADGLRRRIEAKGFLAANEPACGAGAMVIALAEAIRDAGINYQQHLYVVAQDIDRRAAHMAYIQFSLLHIPAVVIVGDTIAMTEHEHWFTPAYILGGWGRKVRNRSSDTPHAVNAAPAIAARPASATEQHESDARPRESQLTLF